MIVQLCIIDGFPYLQNDNPFIIAFQDINIILSGLAKSYITSRYIARELIDKNIH